MKTPFVILAMLAGAFLFSGCSTVGKPMRKSPRDGAPKEHAWFIEGGAYGEDGDVPYSCSFIEFDGRGDFIDRRQLDDALERIRDLSPDTNGSKEKLLLVFYCHGWQNNSHSGDVVEFLSFLGRLAPTDAVAGHGYRVHAVYLSWRGNVMKPYVDERTEFFTQTTNEFGGRIVDRKYQRGLNWPGQPSQLISYWNRRRAAENKVSSLSVANAIMSCASLVKANDRRLGRTNFMDTSRVMVMGHSFGALLLERALGPATMSALVEHWPWTEKQKAMLPTFNPLPLDFVLFVNSAAPSIYAKQMRDFLADHRRAMSEAGIRTAPVIVSLTSTADDATAGLHPLGNVFSPFYKSLSRTYTNLLQDASGRPSNASVHQSSFYKRTPGHNPLLVNRWIVHDPSLPLPSDQSHYNIFDTNLDYEWTQFQFYTSPPPKAPKNRQAKGWKITESVPKGQAKWQREFHGLRPRPVESDYWIIRCDKELIKDHNDVWSQTTMEVYAALYRLVETQRQQEEREIRERAAQAK